MATSKQSSGNVPAVAVQSTLPAFLRDKMGSSRGTENVTTDDITIPRIDVLQSISPAVDQDDESYIEGARAGIIFNTLTRQLYGNEIMIVPVAFKKEQLVWKDRKAGGGFRGAFATVEEAQAAMVAMEDGDQCGIVETSQFYSLVLTKSDENPDGFKIEEVMIPMAKSKMKVARKLNSLIRLNGGDSFTRVYLLKSFKDKNAANETFYNFDCSNHGYVDEVIYARAEKLYEDITAGRVKVDRSTDDSSTGGDGESGTASKF